MVLFKKKKFFSRHSLIKFFKWLRIICRRKPKIFSLHDVAPISLTCFFSNHFSSDLNASCFLWFQMTLSRGATLSANLSGLADPPMHSDINCVYQQHRTEHEVTIDRKSSSRLRHLNVQIMSFISAFLTHSRHF